MLRDLHDCRRSTSDFFPIYDRGFEDQGDQLVVTDVFIRSRSVLTCVRVCAHVCIEILLLLLVVFCAMGDRCSATSP